MWSPYIFDIAFQNWVVKNAFPGWSINPYLMLADKNTKTPVSGMNQLFTIKQNHNILKSYEIIKKDELNNLIINNKILTKVNVSDAINLIYSGNYKANKKKSFEEIKDFSSRLREYAKYYVDDIFYPPLLGSKCKKCEFSNKNNPKLQSGFENCWKVNYPNFSLNDDHIFKIWRLGSRKAQYLIDIGKYRLKDLANDNDLISKIKLNERQISQVKNTFNNLVEENIDDQLYEEIDRLNFPIHFLDFETSISAIPFHKNKSPYEQIAFQFSCHTIFENGKIEHNEWIESRKGEFPNFNLVVELKNILNKDNGTILRYAAHENTVLRQIRKQMIDVSKSKYIDCINWIDEITEYFVNGEKIKGSRNMVDMLDMVKKYYYHSKMEGSNSIKSILPAIFSSSKYIKEIYSKPVGYGKNLKDVIFWKYDKDKKTAHDPYKMLPDVYEDERKTKNITSLENMKIQDGSSALIAYAKMQYTNLDVIEKSYLLKALLQYCELDTLAMVMIYQHWLSKKS